MKACERLAGKLAALETLGPEDAEHVRQCRACSRLQATAQRLALLGRRMGALAEPDAASIKELRARVDAGLRHPVHGARRSWALAGLAGAAALALVLWWPTAGPSIDERATTELFALMDDVADVINPDLSAIVQNDDADENRTEVDDGSWDLPLPAGYIPVVAWLEDRWQ